MATIPNPAMPSVTPPQRWYHPSPDRLILGLLAVQILLFLSQQFQCFAFNERKGWTVLIATAVLGLTMVVLLLWLLASLLLRWRFQFSLQSFLLLVVAIAVPTAWFAAELRRAESQRRTVAAIRATGAWVTYDYRWYAFLAGIETGDLSDPPLPVPQWLMASLGEDFFADVAMVAFALDPAEKPALDCRILQGLVHITYLGLSETQVTDADLANVAELTNLTKLHLGKTQITDQGLIHLKGLANLRELWLDDTQVTDAGLKHLQNLVGLTDLRLSGASITDAGLEHLSGLTGLESLTIDRTQIAGPGLAYLKALPDLKDIHLANTPITDAGLQHLQELVNVEGVSLENTLITDAGLVHLKQMPKLGGVNCRGTQVTGEAYRELCNILWSR
jgi:hypothetical protein